MGQPAPQTWVWLPGHEDLAPTAAVALLYGLLAFLCFRYGMRPDGLPIAWLPAGLALGAMLAHGLRIWPGVGLAAAAAAAISGLAPDAVLLWSFTAVVQPLAAASLLFAAGHADWRRPTLRDQSVAVILAVFLLPALLALVQHRLASPSLGDWITWWLANGLGVLLAAPVATVRRLPHRQTLRARRLDIGIAVISFLAAHLALAVDIGGDWHMSERAAFILVPLLIPCALRLGIAATSGALVLSLLFARGADLANLGVFAHATEEGELVHLATLYGLLGLAYLPLAAAAEQVAATRAALARCRRQLAEAEADFHSLADAASVMIWITDPKGRSTWFNEAWTSFTGRPLELNLGEGWLDAIHPDERTACATAYREAFAGRLPFALDYRVRTAQGEYRWITHRGAARHDAALRFLGYTNHGWDVSDRHDTEQALLERESLLRAIYDASSVGIFLVDRQGRISHANQRTAEMFGWPHELLVGTEYVDHIHPGERNLGRQLMLQLLNADSDRTIDVERRYWRRDGSEFWGQLTGRQLRDSRGGLLGLIGVVADITRRKEAEAGLELAARVFEVAQEGIMVTDTTNHIVSVNPAFTAITGYSAEEALGKTPRLLASGRQDAEFYRKLWTVLLQTGKWQGEVWNRHKSGHIYPEWLSISAVRDSSQMIVNYVGIFSDISERKDAEARIAHLAQYDYLTDLPNRALLYDRLAQALAQAERYERRFAVLFIDLNDFKPVNDIHGHEIGDQLLKAVAERLRNGIRAADTVARHGGDEFVVLVGEAHSRAEVAALAAKLQAAVGAPYACDGRTIAVSASIGYALYPDDGRDITQLMAHADAAMYRGKRPPVGPSVSAQ